MRSVLFVFFLAVLTLLILPASLLACDMMRITGVFVSAEDDPGEYDPSLDVRIAGQPWMLHIRESRHLSDDRSGRKTLRSLRSLSLVGPPELLDYIQSPETRGQPLKIKGDLIRRGGIFRLMTVEPALGSFW